MTGQGDELDKLLPELELEAYREPPMSADDAFGAPPQKKKHEREVARRAWKAIDVCVDAGEPLPDWVLRYLRTVAQRIERSLGPDGGLVRDDAHHALGLGGKAWPKHTPEVVYLTIQSWMNAGKIKGRKEGATRYVREILKDESVPNDRVIDLYKRGKRIVEAD